MEVMVLFNLGRSSSQPENRDKLLTEADAIQLIYHFGGGSPGFQGIPCKSCKLNNIDGK